VGRERDLAISELTLVIALMIVMMTPAMAEIMAFMPRPIADTTLPCRFDTISLEPGVLEGKILAMIY